MLPVQRGTNVAITCMVGMLAAFLSVGCNTGSPQLTPITSQADPPRANTSGATGQDSHRSTIEAVMKAYYSAWEVPRNIRQPGANVRAAVTIAKNGRVLSSHIVQPSGNEVLDKSVQKALDSVRHAPPFKSATINHLDQLTINIIFTARTLESMDWPPKDSHNAGQ